MVRNMSKVTAARFRVDVRRWLYVLALANIAGACGGTRTAEPVDLFSRAVTTTITISGRVMFPGTSPMSGVTVTLSGTRSAVQTTAGGGIYAFSGLPTGSYSVRATRSGFSFVPDVVNLNGQTTDVVVNITGQALPGGWAPSRFFGQPALTQTGVNQVVPNRVFHPTGLLIDRMPAPTPSRLWVFDSGNNRLLGFRNTGRCVGGPTPNAACTEHSGCGGGGSCSSDLNRNADVILGQPSGTDQSSCNRDNTRRMPADRGSLCLIPYPFQVSPLEGPRGGQIATDSAHNLYVVDLFNNRVLRYDDPFSRDAQPDRVWGQANFDSRDCNRGFSGPAADRLCTGEPDHFLFNFYFSGGVDVTPDGSAIWVADLGNHRVLRIPTGGTAANLVLGQPDMTTSNGGCGDPTLSTLCKPNAVRFDAATNRLFVVDGDGENARLLVWNNPTSNGQPASAVWAPPAGSTFFWARGLTLDPTTPGAIWITDTDNSRLLQYINATPVKVLGQPDLSSTGCVGFPGDGPLGPQLCNPHGSIGIDRDGTVYTGDMIDQHIERFRGPQQPPHPDGTAHSPDAYLLNDDSGQGNKIGPAGFDNPGWVLLTPRGMVVSDRRRLLFWTNYATGGGQANGVLGQDNAFTWERQDINHGEDFGALIWDSQRQLLYATNGPFITAWSTQNGLVSAAAPAFQIASPLPLRGGGTIEFVASGIALDQATNSAWISDDRHRIMRILNISQPNRQVDTVIGQPDATSVECNRGGGRELPVATGFCIPTQVTFDRLGNLYVVDGVWEGQGNQRALQFNRTALPAIPAPQVFWPTGGPTPARVYAKRSFTDTQCDPDLINQPCTPRFLSFEPGTNRMVMTVDGCGATCAQFNPLESRAFLYNNPVPAGVVAPTPSGRIPLVFNQAAASSWDDARRLAIIDHTWNRVLLINSPPP